MDQELIDGCYQVAKDGLLTDWINHVSGLRFPSGGGASFAMVGSAGTPSKLFNRAACHSAVGSISTDTRKLYQAIITLAIPVEVGEKIGWSGKELLAYYRYIANEGPVKHMFVTKDPEVMVNQGIILDLAEDRGCHLLMALLQTRLPWEVTTRAGSIEKFNYLLNRGVAPSLSYMVSVGIYNNRLVPQYVGFSHSPYDWATFNNEKFKRLLLDIPDTNGSPYYEGGWRGAFRLFGNAPSDTITYAIVKKIDKILATIPKPVATFSETPKEPLTNSEDNILQQIGDYLVEVQNQILTLPVNKQTWKEL